MMTTGVRAHNRLYAIIGWRNECLGPNSIEGKRHPNQVQSQGFWFIVFKPVRRLKFAGEVITKGT